MHPPKVYVETSNGKYKLVKETTIKPYKYIECELQPQI